MRLWCPLTEAWLAFDRCDVYIQCIFCMRDMLPVRQLGESVSSERNISVISEKLQLWVRHWLHFSPVNAMPPVVIGIIQTLTEGQSVTDKLLGLCLISQLLLFRFTLQLNREKNSWFALILRKYWEGEKRRNRKDNKEERKRKRGEKREEGKGKEEGKTGQFVHH